MGDTRAALADRIRDAVDGLAILEQLWAVALATAALTIAIGLALRAAQVTVSDVLQPAEGFAVAALVSLVGYWRVRERSRRRLRSVAQAATKLLDGGMGAGLGLIYGGTVAAVTIRGLARAYQHGRLEDELAYGRGLAGGLDGLRNVFEHDTAHHVDRLSPPRANTEVDRAIRALVDASAAAAAYDAREYELSIELRHEPTKRRAQLGDLTAALGKELLRVKDAAEQLEEMNDRGTARALREKLDYREAEASRQRIALQKGVAADAEQLLIDALPDQELLERSSIARHVGSLREIASLDLFTLATDDEPDALADWRHRIGLAQQTFQQRAGGHGQEMHFRTHTAWTNVNGALSDVDRAITDLQDGLETAPKLTPQELADGALERITTGRRGKILREVKALVERVDELEALEVR